MRLMEQHRGYEEAGGIYVKELCTYPGFADVRGYGKERWGFNSETRPRCSTVYAVLFVLVSCVRSMDPPHPQPGPQQQQLKSYFTSVSQLLF